MINVKELAQELALTEQELWRQGKVAEKDILEDFQNVDYLTARIKRLEQLLERL